MNPKQEAFLTRALEELDRQGFLPVSSSDLARILVVPVQAAKSILDLGTAHHRLIRLDPDLYYSLSQSQRAVEAFGKGAEASQFRERTGLSRRLADLVLKALVEEGWLTKRGSLWLAVDQRES